MAHHSRVSMIVIDVPAADHDAELAFWQGATGQRLRHNQRFPEYHGAALPGRDHGFGLLVQKVGEGAARVHLDIHTDDVAAEVDRLEKLGATRLREVSGWWIMQDPAGLPFCVIPDATPAATGPEARRWP